MPHCRLRCVIALLHESRDPKRMNSYAKTAARMMARALAAMRHWGRQATAVLGRGVERVRQLANVDAQAPDDPL